MLGVRLLFRVDVRPPARGATLRAYLAAIDPQPLGAPLRGDDAARWLAWALGDAGAGARLLGGLARRAGVAQRATCVGDHLVHDEDELRLYQRNDRGVLDAALEDRMERFEQTARAVAQQALAPVAVAPDHLLQVSCTGYGAPSAVQSVAVERGWLQHTRLLSIGHMGCHAAVPALRTAVAAVRSTAWQQQRHASAAIVHIELCTLHLDLDPVERHWWAQALLFADGAARLDVTTSRPRRGFEVLDDFEHLLPDTGDAMTWRLAGNAFRMHLGREVPAVVRGHTEPAVRAFLARNGLRTGDIASFAVHPGGPRILDACAGALGLPSERYHHATDVLREHGNMSSATLPHVWAATLDDATIGDGDLVCSVAFGPGLTITGNLLRVVGEA